MFKIGDGIVVGNREEVESDPKHFVKHQLAYCGKIGKIVDIAFEGYLIDIDELMWYWGDKQIKKVDIGSE